MKIESGSQNRLRLMVAILSVGSCISSASWADGNKTIEQLEHKEKSTLETFRLNAIEEAELSEAVIAGGLEPTSAGGYKSAPQPVTMYEDASLLLPIDRETDLGRYEIPVTLNYSEPRNVPGNTYNETYSIQPTPDIGGRSYQYFDANVTER
jgi:hypothetical protein